MRLEDNFLTGNIPHELSLAKNLRTLVLNNNRLTGDIPSEFATLENLGKS